MKLRADQWLVERGLAESRARAQAAIAAGLVTADGAVVRKASSLLSPEAQVTARAAHPYVSRGGLKLRAGLDAFGFDPAGRLCLDVGASTGGFTDVLLGCGAAQVVAVDVGRDQLHPSLRGDQRILSFEAQDIRTMPLDALPGRPGFACIDVSFISLRLVLPAVAALLAPDAALVALIKPQFEAGRAALKKGVVKDATMHEAVCADIVAVLAGLGFSVLGPIPSPIEGGDGNREFLIGGQRSLGAAPAEPALS